VVMSAEKKNFQTLSELTECMRCVCVCVCVCVGVDRLPGSAPWPAFPFFAFSTIVPVSSLLLIIF
jgi:hypothetical protein